MPDRAHKRNPYATDIRTPIHYTASYFLLIGLLAYFMGVQIATPFDGLPVGMASASPAQDPPKMNSTAGIAEEFIGSVRVVASPQQMRGKPMIKTDGFNALQPISTKADMTDGSIEMTLMKVLPTAVYIEDITITNAATGKRCATVGYDRELAADTETFGMNATGCDPEASAGVTAYDVSTAYRITIGSDAVERVNNGRITVWS